MRRFIVLIKSLPLAIMLLTLVAPTMHILMEHEDHDHHAHAVGACSEEAGLDPCHRKLVHHDSDVDCGHESHILEAKWHCEWCDQITPRHHYTLEHAPVEWNHLDFEKTEALWSADLITAELDWNRGRAPPVLV